MRIIAYTKFVHIYAQCAYIKISKRCQPSVWCGLNPGLLDLSPASHQCFTAGMVSNSSRDLPSREMRTKTSRVSVVRVLLRLLLIRFTQEKPRSQHAVLTGRIRMISTSIRIFWSINPWSTNTFSQGVVFHVSIAMVSTYNCFQFHPFI